MKKLEQVAEDRYPNSDSEIYMGVTIWQCWELSLDDSDLDSKNSCFLLTGQLLRMETEKHLNQAPLT